mgnify:CR=1 FL=1|tara:strand:+ start:154 stop:714 length:561 start_codon:yes stop_codon:yes gene_type:complete
MPFQPIKLKDISKLWHKKIIPWLSALPFVKRILRHRVRISNALSLILLYGCGKWVYEIYFLEVTPLINLQFFVKINSLSSQEGMLILFSGSVVLFAFLIICFFLIKFIYNVLWEPIRDLFPIDWACILKPIFLLTILWFAFSGIEKIKLVGITAHYQIKKLVNKAKKYDGRVSSKSKTSSVPLKLK